MESRNRASGDIKSTKMDTQNRDEAIINQWPKLDDPKEKRIVDAIRSELLATDWAKGVFENASKAQLEHIKSSLKHLGDPQFIHDNTQKLLAELAKMTNSKIVRGSEYLEDLPKGKPVLLLTNHLGGYKLNSWLEDDLKKKTSLSGPVQPKYYHFPLYYSAMHPIAQALEDNLYIASFEYPGKLGEIFRASGSIEVPPKEFLEEGKSRTETLTDSTRILLNSHPNAVITSFPEGGTTGKRNGGGPYDLEDFHTGSYVIAKDLGLTILPVAQYFNPKSGFELKIFKPIKLDSDATEDDLHKISEQNHNDELVWLKQREG